MQRKLAYGLGALVLLVAAATTFRLVTGQCPIGCVLKHLNGEKVAEKPAQN